jgi:hypothetical protein
MPVIVEEQEEVQRRPPTYMEVIDSVIVAAEAAGLTISPAQAVAFILFLDEAVMTIRNDANKFQVPVGRVTYHIHELDLERFHPLMTIIMPNEAVARPGSAHDLINALLLSGNEIGLRHTGVGEELVYCAFALDIDTIGD